MCTNDPVTCCRARIESSPLDDPAPAPAATKASCVGPHCKRFLQPVLDFGPYNQYIGLIECAVVAKLLQ